MKHGFTLVEILVVIAVLGVVGIIILLIFTNTLRGSNKTQILSSLKQNGQSVLETMDKTVRGADNVICPSFTSSTQTTISSDTLVMVKNGVYTRFKFSPPSSSANGSITQDFPVQPTADQKSQITVFLAAICTDPAGIDAPNSEFRTITDSNTQKGVSVVNGLFTRNRLSGSKDQVIIKFELLPGVQAPAAVAGQIDPVTFQTTIQLR